LPSHVCSPKNASSQGEDVIGLKVGIFFILLVRSRGSTLKASMPPLPSPPPSRQLSSLPSPPAITAAVAIAVAAAAVTVTIAIALAAAITVAVALTTTVTTIAVTVAAACGTDTRPMAAFIGF
jgi:hypothetical protein